MESGVWGQPWGSWLHTWDQGHLPWHRGMRDGCSSLECHQHEAWPLCVVGLTQTLLLHKLSAWFHQLCRSCRKKKQQNLIFIFKVRCSSSMCPWKADRMSKKMPFPCIHFSVQKSLFMQWVQFCKSPYWGQHNLLIIESSGKFCSSENWQIKPIRQFSEKIKKNPKNNKKKSPFIMLSS